MEDCGITETQSSDHNATSALISANPLQLFGKEGNAVGVFPVGGD